MTIQWPLVMFSLLSGAGAGLLVAVGIAELFKPKAAVRVPALAALLLLLVVGGLASILHLEQPANVMAAAANIGSLSGISVEVILLSCSVACVLAFLLASKKTESQGLLKALAVAGIICGLLLCFALGNSYVISARENWNTVALPFGYFASNLTMGAFLYLVLRAIWAKIDAEGEVAESSKLLCGYALGTSVLWAISLVLYAGSIGFDVVDALWYWGASFAVGAIVPAFCVGIGFAGKAGKNPIALMSAACAATVIGGIGFRITMWIVGYGMVDLFESSRYLLG